MEEGADCNAWAIGRRTPLHEAALKGRGDAIIKLLLGGQNGDGVGGAEIDATAETYGLKRMDMLSTPLHEAIYGVSLPFNRIRQSRRPRQDPRFAAKSLPEIRTDGENAVGSRRQRQC